MRSNYLTELRPGASSIYLCDRDMKGLILSSLASMPVVRKSPLLSAETFGLGAILRVPKNVFIFVKDGSKKNYDEL